MSGSTENRASGAPRASSKRNQVMNLGTARKMLPLVRRIVTDLLEHQKELDKLQPELDRLDRHRRDLVWLERQRRYAIREEISQREESLKSHVSELQVLGVVIVDADIGRIGFPTVVNNRPAFFAWWPGEDGIMSWHFATETRCRTIPEAWFEGEQTA